MRVAPLALVLSVACGSDASVTIPDEIMLDRAVESDPASAAADTVEVDRVRGLEVPGVQGSIQASSELADGGLLSSSGGADAGLATRPVAVVLVVDQNADMHTVQHLMNEPGLVTLRALDRGVAPYHVGMIGHVDRHAHLLHPMQPILPADRTMAYGTASMSTSCSTAVDPEGWAAVNYFNDVVTAPVCWSDEVGRDPATALAFAANLLAHDAPPDAEKAVILVGGRAPEALEAGSLRPDGWNDPMPTWTRSDKYVEADILEEHASFVLSALDAEGVRVLHVPLDEQPDLRWIDMLGAEAVTEGPVQQRLYGVQTFIEELQDAARD